MRICKSCGSENPDTLSFCDICGTQLGSSSSGDYKIVCLLALIFGIVAFVINPLYLLSVAAVTLGIIGHINSSTYKTWAMIGWILGASSLIVQIIIDWLFCGWGIFC